MNCKFCTAVGCEGYSDEMCWIYNRPAADVDCGSWHRDEVIKGLEAELFNCNDEERLILQAAISTLLNK